MATGIVFGLAPALQGRGAALTNALKDATRGSTEGRRRAWVRNALVVAEIAFACVLVVGAGLLVRSLMRVLEVDMGFVPRGRRPSASIRTAASRTQNSGTRTTTRCCAA